MNTKLTLSLNKDIVEAAKQYAKQQNNNLSSIIERYLLKLISDVQTTHPSPTSIVEELSGVISLPSDFNYRDELNSFLTRKYE